MTTEELDEAILELSEAEYGELEGTALDYCLDHSKFTRSNDHRKEIMLLATMRMMIQEQLNSPHSDHGEK